jgi:hypothetical protein
MNSFFPLFRMESTMPSNYTDYMFYTKSNYRKISLLLIALMIAITVNSQVAPSVTGMKLFDDWNPDRTGVVDVTDSLQAAVDWCINNSKTLYISPGTYKVSKRILGKVTPGNNNGTHNGTKAITITGDAINRPLIRLVDKAVGFQGNDISKSLAVIELQQAARNAESVLFWCGIRNLDIDLGDNPGAVGVKFNSAQDCHLINVRVYGKNFAAGFTGVPGRNATTLNCEVNGGNYGFYLTNSVGANLFGIKCTGQTVAGLYLNIIRGSSFAGVEITGCKGTAVVCRPNPSTGSVTINAGQDGNLVLTDAVIEMANPESFAFDISDRLLVLRNVYVKGTGNVVLGNKDKWSLKAGKTIHIDTYSVTPDSISGYKACDVIDGVKKNAIIRDFKRASGVPADIISRHLPEQIYAFNSPGVVNVAAYGAVPDDGVDDYPAFQRAIDENPIVFVPAGKYHLSNALLLRKGSVLFGETGKRSHLVPLYVPESNSWMIITPDTEGKVVIQDLAFDTPDKPHYGAVKWQTSNGYMLNLRNYMASSRSEFDSHNWEFCGNAGGKFYGLADHGQIRRRLQTGPDFYKVYVSGTFNPITFYGLNLERGGVLGNTPQNPYFTAVNSSNIRIFGAKTETDGQVFSFSACDNIMVSAILTHVHMTNEPVDPAIVALKDGTKNVELSLIFCPHRKEVPMIMDEAGNTLKRSEFLGLYRLGRFKTEVFNN